MGKVIRVKKGNQEFDVDESKLQLALNDGFTPVKEEKVLTVIKGDKEFQVKESNLSAAMADGFKKKDITNIGGTPSNDGTTPTSPSSSSSSSDVSEPTQIGGFKSRTEEEIFNRKGNPNVSDRFKFDPLSKLKVPPQTNIVEIGGEWINLEKNIPSIVADPKLFAETLKKKIQSKSPLTEEEFTQVKTATGFDDELTNLALNEDPNFTAVKTVKERDNKKSKVVDYLSSQDHHMMVIGKNLFPKGQYLNYDLEDKDNVEKLFARFESDKKEYEAKAAESNPFDSNARIASSLAADNLKANNAFMQTYNNLKDWKAQQVAENLVKEGITDTKKAGIAIQQATDADKTEKYWKSHSPDIPTGFALIDGIRSLSSNDTPLQDYELENTGANYLKQALLYQASVKKLSGQDSNYEVDEYMKVDKAQSDLYKKYPDVRYGQIIAAISDAKASEEGLTIDTEKNGIISRVAYQTTGEDVIRIAKENGLYNSQLDKELVDKIAGKQEVNPMIAMFVPAYGLYKKVTAPIENVSFAGQLTEGISGVFENTGKSIIDLAQLRGNNKISAEQYNQDVINTWKKDQSNLDETQKNIALVGNTSGQIVGQALTTLAFTGVGKAAGLAQNSIENLGFWASGALSSYEDGKKSMLDITGSDAKAESGALLIAFFNAVTEKMFKDTKVFGDVFGKRVGNILKNIDEDKLFTQATRNVVTKELKSYIPQWGKHFVVEGNKDAFEEFSTAALQDITEAVLGDNTKFNITKTWENARDTYVSTLIGGSLAAGRAAHTNIRINPNAATSLYHASQNPNYYISSIKELKNKNQISETDANKKIQLINTAAAINNEITQVDKKLNDRQKSAYISYRTTQAQLQELSAKTTDGTLKGKMDENIKVLDEQKDRILKGLQFNKNLQPLNELFDKEQAVRTAEEKYNEERTAEAMASLEIAKSELSQSIINYYQPKQNEIIKSGDLSKYDISISNDDKLQNKVDELRKPKEPAVKPEVVAEETKIEVPVEGLGEFQEETVVVPKEEPLKANLQAAREQAAALPLEQQQKPTAEVAPLQSNLEAARQQGVVEESSATLADERAKQLLGQNAPQTTVAPKEQNLEAVRNQQVQKDLEEQQLANVANERVAQMALDKIKMTEKATAALAKMDKVKGKKLGVYREIAKQNPKGFLKEVAQQARGILASGVKDVKTAMKEVVKNYTQDVVDEALAMFPEENKPIQNEPIKEALSTTVSSEGVSGSALKDVEVTQEQKVNETTKKLENIDKADLEFISRKENNRRKGGFYEKAKGILFKGFGGNASIISDKFGSKYKYFTDNPDYAKSFSLEKEYLTQKGKVEKYETNYKKEFNTNEKDYNNEVLRHSGKKSINDLTSKDFDNFNDKLKADGYDVVKIKRTEPLIPSESYRGHSADIRNVEVEEHLILNENVIKKIADQPLLLENNAKSIAEAYHKAKADGTNPELVKAVEDLLGKAPTQYTEAATPKKESGGVSGSALKDVGTKQQIENFGVPKEDVDATHGLLNQVFSGLKKAGLTAAKTVGDWVGIGKGSEKPYSLKIGDKEVQVKNMQPEVVNGFYSPLEKVITESKFDKLPAKQWAEKYANSEEAKWTGLKDWLNQQQGSVSKTDIQQFLKDNRIQVVEVVNSGKSEKYYQLVEEQKNASRELDILESDLDNWSDENYKESRDKKYELNDKIKELSNQIKEEESKTKDTKFENYQLEGQKENYKEVLVTMPAKLSASEMDEYRSLRNVPHSYATPEQRSRFMELERNSNEGKFKSSHFDEPNILVHLRMNTRVDAEGNKVLFLEEVQSDWGQKGKKEGFEIKEEDRWNFEPIKRNGETVAWKIELKSDKNIGGIGNTKEDAIKDANKRYGTEINTLEKQQKGTPSAPFVTDTNAWTKLGLKVAIKEAVKQGADKIAWTTGEQQNDRYDLSKSVDGLEYQPQRDGKYDVFAHKGDNNIFYEKGIDLKRIEDVFGKDIADKISKNEGTKATYDPNKFYKRLEGDGLKVGGKGMKGFYGSPTEGSLGIVGNVAKSLFKQEPKTVEIETAKNNEYTLGEANYVDGIGVYDGKGDMVAEFDTKAEANKFIAEKSNQTQHSIDITPEMKAEVEGKGQPLFKDAEAQYRIESGKNIIEAIKDFNQSKNKARATVALTHEIMHPTVVSIIDGAKEGNEVGTKHTETIVNEFNKANPNSKVTVEDLIQGNDAFKDGTTSKQYRQVQEFIAKAWEKYHTEGGKGFSEAFQKVLDQITKAFQSVYKSITGKQLTPELKQMFDEILGKEATTQYTEAATPKPTVSSGVDFTAKGGNKVVDDKGEPITVYHTTNAENIGEFKTSGEIETLAGKVKNEGAYFTPNKGEYAHKGGNEHEVQISIKNPYITTDQIESAIISPEKKADLISKGHDGVILMRNGKPAEYIVFDKSQIKSAEQPKSENKPIQNEPIKEALSTTVSNELPKIETTERDKRLFSDIASALSVVGQKNKEAAIESLYAGRKAKYSKEEVDAAIAINKDFEKIVAEMQKDELLTKECKT